MTTPRDQPTRSKPGPAKGTPRKPYGPSESEVDFIWSWLLDPVRPLSIRQNMVLFHPEVPDRVLEGLLEDPVLGRYARHRLVNGCGKLG